MKQIVFLGSKPIGAACLQYLIDHKEKLNIEIIAAKTTTRKELDEGQTVEHLADQYQIPLLHSLDDLPECDIIYSVQHNELLLERHIQKARQIAVNLHLAPLPEYRGCNQFSFAIMDEANEFGVTIHEIDTKIDHGAWLFQERFPIDRDIWVKELLNKTTEVGIQLFQNTLADIVQENYDLKSYPEDVPSQLHYRKEINDLKKIDPTLPEEEIKKRIRATAMPGFEPPYYWKDGKKIYVDLEKNL